MASHRSVSSQPLNPFLLICHRLINKWKSVLLVIECHWRCMCSLCFTFKMCRESNIFAVLRGMGITHKDFHQRHSNWTEINLQLSQQSLSPFRMSWTLYFSNLIFMDSEFICHSQLSFQPLNWVAFIRIKRHLSITSETVDNFPQLRMLNVKVDMDHTFFPGWQIALHGDPHTLS